MGISLLWLSVLSLVSGKLGNVEVKEMLCPTCLATTELSNTNKACCLLNGERRSLRLKSSSAVIIGFLLSILFWSTLQWVVDSWFADSNRQTNKWFMGSYWVMPCPIATFSLLWESSVIFFLTGNTRRGLSTWQILAGSGGRAVKVCYEKYGNCKRNMETAKETEKLHQRNRRHGSYSFREIEQWWNELKTFSGKPKWICIQCILWTYAFERVVCCIIWDNLHESGLVWEDIPGGWRSRGRYFC